MKILIRAFQHSAFKLKELAKNSMRKKRIQKYCWMGLAELIKKAWLWRNIITYIINVSVTVNALIIDPIIQKFD